MSHPLRVAIIGAGAVIGSVLPAVFAHLGIANTAPEGVVPDSVRLSFFIGAAAMVLAVAWTAFTVHEYSPEDMAAFGGENHAEPGSQPLVYSSRGPLWLALGFVLLTVVGELELDKQLYVLGGGLVAFGLAQIVLRALQAKGALVEASTIAPDDPAVLQVPHAAKTG